MFESIKKEYVKLLLSMIAGILIMHTVNITTEAKDFLTYHKTNIQLDSLQTKQIKELSTSMSRYATKIELNYKDSIMIDKLNQIGDKQIVFQNNVIERYDARCNTLTDNQNNISNDLREVIGVLKALHFITLEMYNESRRDELTVQLELIHPEKKN